MKTADSSRTAAAPTTPVVPDPRRILVLLDLNGDSRPALRCAARLAHEPASSVWLLHVVDFGLFKAAVRDFPLYHSTAHIVSRAERYLRMLARQELPAGVPVRVIVRPGRTARESLRLAREVCADFIVLGAPRRNWLARVLSGGLVRRIEAKAPCSVVVLRETDYGACDCFTGFAHQAATLPA